MALRRFSEQIDVLKQQKEDVEQAIEELTRTMSIVVRHAAAVVATDEPQPLLEAAE